MRLVARALSLACLLGTAAGAARGEPVTFQLGYGGAAEEPMWLLIAKPDLAKNYGKAYRLDATRFVSSDKRAQAFEAGAIDLSVGGANGVIFAAAEGVTAKFIASISRESQRGFSTSFFVKESSPVRSVSGLKGKIVGINGFSTSGHLWLKAALDKHGLSDADVTITPVPFSAMQFYLSDPRAARQALIDARMVRADPEVYMTMRDYYRDPSLRVDADALEQMQAFQIKAGFQTKRVDVRALVDLSYLPK